MVINHCRGWICSELPSWLLFVDGTDAFSGVVVLLCFEDYFTCFNLVTFRVALGEIIGPNHVRKVK